MKQETNNKFAEILAAAQAKAANKSTPNFTAKTATPAKDKGTANTPKEYDNLKDIEQAAKDGKTISLLNLSNLVNQKPKPAVILPAPTQEPEQQEAPSMLSLFHILWQEGSGKFDGKTFTTWHTADKAMIAIYNEHSGQGYLKTKVHITWQNGQEITTRIDCSDSIGDFCPKRETVETYLKKRYPELKTLSFSDDDNQAELKRQYENQETTPQATGSQTPELSQLTFEELMNEKAPEFCAPQPFILPAMKPAEPQAQPEPTPAPEPLLKIVDYSDRSFAIVTAEKPSEEILNVLRQHGTFNKFLKCGKGWIFSKRHLPAIKAKLGL